MKKLIGFLFAVIVLLSFIPHAEAIIVDFDTIADAYVCDGSPATPYGAWNGLRAGNTSDGYTLNTFLKFNLSLIPDSATINSAHLHLYVSHIFNPIPSTPVASRILDIDRVSDTTWTEGGITWNNQPTLDTRELIFSLTGLSTIGWSSFNLFQSGALGRGNLENLAVHASNDGFYGFRSKEYPIDLVAPYLSIDYTPIPEPCSLVLMSLGLLGTGIFKRRFKKNGHCV